MVVDYLPEFRDKKGSPIRDNTIREAIEAPDIIKEDLTKVNSFYSGIIRKVIALFNWPVNSNYNYIKF